MINQKIQNIVIIYEIRCLDSFAFMLSPLESSANNLRSFSDYVNKLRKVFKNTSDEFKNDEQFLLMIH